MQCPSCEIDTAADGETCAGCGAPLTRTCPACGFASPPAFQFCGACGSSLDAAPPAAPTEVERRQLTVMFCDLVGSTGLSEELDPEELREVMLAYQGVCCAVVERYGGHVAQYLGDGLLIYFGYPRAHEDDARRSLGAGLEIVADVRRLRFDRLLGRDLKLVVRVGIHTGEVVTGEVGGGETREHLALGSVPNVAARLQGLAEPGTMVASAATCDLTRGFFDLRSLGLQNLRGVTDPIEVFRVLGRTSARDRLEVAAERTLSPAIGRRRELDLLGERFARAAAGDGGVVLVAGEAGIGKSRLLNLLRQRLADEAPGWLVCRAAAHYQASAFHPVQGLLRWLFELSPDEPPAVRLEKLDRGLARQGLDPAAAVPLFAALLEIPLGGAYPAPGFSPQKRKEQTLDLLVELVARMTGGRPGVLVIEDLHWIDPSTLELIARLVERTASLPLLLLLTFRPEFAPPWAAPPHQVRIDIDRLTGEEVAALVAGVTGGRALPDEILRHIVAKTDGVPLFVEELTRMVLGSDLVVERDGRFELADEGGGNGGDTRRLAIPTSLQGSLMARLDQLGAAKNVAQLGAVIGREFSAELLAAVSPLSADELHRRLDRLVASGLVFAGAVAPAKTFVFKHALVQDAAYGSLLRSARKRLHGQVGRVLETRFPRIVEREPELLAQHFGEGGRVEQAVGYWQRAGRRATERWAHREALSHHQRGLELVHELPESVERDRLELDLQTARGAGLSALEGFASPDVERIYGRAQELCERLGNTPLPTLWRLWLFNLVRGNRVAERVLTERFERIADEARDAEHRLVANVALALDAIVWGEPPAALARVAMAKAFYHPDQHRRLVLAYGDDPGLYCCLYNVWAGILAGRLDLAREELEQGLGIAEELADPYNVAVACSYGATLYFELRDPAGVRAMADRLFQIAEEQIFTYWQAVAMCGHGWVETETGDAAAGIEEMEQGIAAFQASGAKIPYNFLLTYLINGQLTAGHVENGLARVAEGLELSRATGAAYQDAELYRLKGELLYSRDGATEEVEACFHHALALARSRHAGLFELRAAASLGRLLRPLGRGREVRGELAAVLDRLPEGRETPDHTSARDLLAALG